jgi:hypothetical protein
MSSLLATNNSAIETATGASAVEPGVTQVGTSGATDWEKRYKDLQSFHDRETAKLRTDLKTAQNSTFVPPSTVEDIEAFKVEHPDLFNMIQTLSDQRAQSRSHDVSTQVQTLAQDSQMTKADLARAAILKSHPDFAVIVNSPEFRIWATEQDTSIQDGIYRNPDNAKLAIAVLDMYKAAVATSSKNSSSTQDTASSADAINTGSSQADPKGNKIWKGSEIKALSPAQYEKLEEQIDQAWEEGRVDLSQ